MTEELEQLMKSLRLKRTIETYAEQLTKPGHPLFEMKNRQWMSMIP
jgi:hypothetical protein